MMHLASPAGWAGPGGKNMGVAMPSLEAARVAALNRYAILDTEPEQTFDDLVTLAAYVCKTPIAMLSLVDDHRQWFKSKVGVEVRETPVEISFCVHAIKQQDVFIVPDALKDDPLDQKIIACAHSLASMAASGQFQDDGTCH